MTAPQDQRRADQGRLAAQIGELLRAERHRARLSQAALARAAGTAQQCVSQLETGRYAPTTAVVERLFAALDCQLRLDIEPRDADLDGLIASAGEQPADDVDAALDGLRALARTAGDLEYLLDGELAARLHGVPVIVRPAYPIAVAEADLDGLAAWICAVPNCRRYSERWRDFSDYDVDPTHPGPLRWWTPFGELAVRLLPRLPEPVTVQVGERALRLRPLPEIERDDPQVARVLRRLRAASDPPAP
jgi:transcriptional regulator with XRE-family HTH domain